eukprot:CAMPEP_0185841440 /NCGR_PEP_ID=MMETSP1353-20130828/17894_1 /TAXON_ID=1077150 /ORGANISM="Erythrolobus australicus, Strain CCMP3124" /LENGTH=146 /DNA_ID=CAMNT_0028540913 /DNA_START=331 /DNA_END=772 /DNA_ORIENTATION=+
MHAVNDSEMFVDRAFLAKAFAAPLAHIQPFARVHVPNVLVEVGPPLKMISTGLTSERSELLLNKRTASHGSFTYSSVFSSPDPAASPALPAVPLTALRPSVAPGVLSSQVSDAFTSDTRALAMSNGDSPFDLNGGSSTHSSLSAVE